MTEEEFVGVGDEFEDEELEDEDEESTPEGTCEIRVFFHTGSTQLMQLPYGTTVREMRKQLEEQGRSTYGSTVLRNGAAIDPDYEEEVELDPGDIVVFSGSVKGGD
jgi:flavodoxin